MHVIPVALSIALAWGASPIIHKYVLRSADPLTVMILSGIIYTICVIVFVIFNWKRFYKSVHTLTRTSKKSIMWLAVTAIICGFIPNIVYFYILNKNDSYIVSALIYASPIFTLILAYYVLKEKITPIGFTGVILIMLGVLCIAFNENTNHERFIDIDKI